MPLITLPKVAKPHPPLPAPPPRSSSLPSPPLLPAPPSPTRPETRSLDKQVGDRHQQLKLRLQLQQLGSSGGGGGGGADGEQDFDGRLVDPAEEDWFKWNAFADEEEDEGIPLARVVSSEAAAVLRRYTPGWSPISTTFIKNEETDEILYILKRHWSWSSIIVTDYCHPHHQQRRSQNDPASDPADSGDSSLETIDSGDTNASGELHSSKKAGNHHLPYARVQSSHIEIASPTSPSSPSSSSSSTSSSEQPASKQAKTKVPLRRFSYDERKTWYGIPSIFIVEGREYVLRGPHRADAPLSVYRRDSGENGLPLMTLNASSNWQQAGDIYIPGQSVYYGRDERRAPQDSVLVNGKPTALLDYALVAETLYR